MCGVAVGEALGDVLCPGDAVPAAEADGVAEGDAVDEPDADGEGLAAFTGIGLESSTTPHTVQVRCSRPSFVAVDSSTTLQSVATCPGAGICSV